MKNDNEITLVGREMYYIIFKSYGYIVDKGEVIFFHKSTNMYSVRNKLTGDEYIVKSNRIFRLKTDAIKRCNTLKRFVKEGKNIPSLL